MRWSTHCMKVNGKWLGVLGLLVLTEPAGASYLSLSTSPVRHIPFANVVRERQFTLYVVALLWPGDVAEHGIQGAEFRLDLPDGWVIQSTPNVLAHLSSGNMAANGASIFFPMCQEGGASRMVVLYTLNVFPMSDYEGDIHIRAHTFPANPAFSCSNLVTCSRPSFITVCVSDFAFCVNPGGGACTTAVEESRWTQVKEMYR